MASLQPGLDSCLLLALAYTQADSLQWKTRTVHQYSILEEGNYFRFQESKTTKLNTSWGFHRGKIEEVFRTERLQIVNFQICTISLNL